MFNFPRIQAISQNTKIPKEIDPEGQAKDDAKDEKTDFFNQHGV